jgi:hypothetical protein
MSFYNNIKPNTPTTPPAKTLYRPLKSLIGTAAPVDTARVADAAVAAVALTFMERVLLTGFADDVADVSFPVEVDVMRSLEVVDDLLVVVPVVSFVEVPAVRALVDVAFALRAMLD